MRNRIILAALLTLSVAAASCKRNPSVWDNPDMWYQSSMEFDASKTDVIYIVSTDVLSAKDKDGNVSWQSLLIDEDKEAMGGEIAWVERNMFYDDFNFSAPFYHQFTFDALWQLDKEEFEKTYLKVAEEACEAFDCYMKNCNNGRPFILAGFSQGAMLTLDILKHMTDEQYSRMVACYTIGYRLSAEDLSHPHIKAATGENDRGVVVSFNSTQSKEAIWPFVCDGAAACINPVNWKTDQTPATFTFEGTTNTAHIDPETNVLLVDTDDPDYYRSFYEVAPFFKDAGVSTDNLHHWDLMFYSHQIHDNALLRSGK